MKRTIFRNLTEREKQIYNAITLLGCVNRKEIAAQLGLKDPNIISVYLTRMYNKINIPYQWCSIAGILWYHFKFVEGN